MTPKTPEEIREIAGHIRNGGLAELAANGWLDAAAETLEYLLQFVEWRPIESAPKDQCLILAVTGGNSGPVVGEARWQENGEDSDWYWAGNGPGDYHGGSISEINSGSASHWLPLPPPPQKKEGEEK